MSIIRYVGEAEDACVVISFCILKNGRLPSMEDRTLRGRHCHRAFVTQATTAVINNGALCGSTYNVGRPYRSMTILRGEVQQTCRPRHVCIDVLSKCNIVFY